ncbi:mediator of RNA polymerase II transcription subunit 10 isoform X1 [Prinia subflava]|uniref:mediator of RNA polymerase II transcription subunit 10 isoform X1 n=1 Tax=Prinia subflava TaxID=208062 RepID=UPI002FE0DC39
MAEKFDSLEEHLEKFVENIRQLGIIVSDFQPSSQTGLNQKLNFMVTGLQDIDKCRQQLHDISVPLEVFECNILLLSGYEITKPVLQLSCKWRRSHLPCARSQVVEGSLFHMCLWGSLCSSWGAAVGHRSPWVLETASRANESMRWCSPFQLPSSLWLPITTNKRAYDRWNPSRS